MNFFEQAKLQIEQSYTLTDKQTNEALRVLEYTKSLY